MLSRWSLLVLVLLLAACGAGEPSLPQAPPTLPPSLSSPAAASPTPAPSATPAPPPPTATASATLAPVEVADSPATATVPPSATTLPTATPDPGQADGRAEEEILILAPGNGSVVTSPITVRGEAEPTFEQTLVVRLVTMEGEELLLTPTTIQSDLGERGSYEVELAFEVSGVVPAMIQIFATSPKDGGITHLNSVNVRLSENGPAVINVEEDRNETIEILSPAANATISGGTVLVQGFGLAIFEQTLVVDLLDEEGRVLAREPLIVQAPDLGIPGPFEVELNYVIGDRVPGRILVYDSSPAFGGTVHLTSIPVQVAP